MSSTTIFLCGDVMTGRGLDQVLPHPSDPVLHEPCVKSAIEYVEMAERANGSIQKPASFSYIWGDAIAEWERVAPQTRIVNLETSITASEDYDRKGINYRMHPANTPCLTAAKLDCCVLANNHVLDWGPAGLKETLDVLHDAGIKTAGAGWNLREALEPAVIQLSESRVLIFAFGMTDSGVPREWAAADARPGVALLSGPLETRVAQIAERVHALKRPGDIAILSVHWGSNWGYETPPDHRILAHRLIDEAGVDIVHGHSSHHPKPMEVYHGKLILYGCGDFLNDYEGIAGYEEFRDDLVLMYFVSLDPSTGNLQNLAMTPLKIQRFRLNCASHDEAAWLQDTLTREGQQTRTRLERCGCGLSLYVP
jgi:poly-gamma-glutamate capsule biosynthesis protein CapA/YwtB (metallophosphatase superfamily)